MRAWWVDASWHVANTSRSQRCTRPPAAGRAVRSSSSCPLASERSLHHTITLCTKYYTIVLGFYPKSPQFFSERHWIWVPPNPIPVAHGRSKMDRARRVALVGGMGLADLSALAKFRRNRYSSAGVTCFGVSMQPVCMIARARARRSRGRSENWSSGIQDFGT